MKNTLLILILFINSSMAWSNIKIPLENQLLHIDLDKTYQLKKKCQKLKNINCYEIWNEVNFLSLYITKLNSKIKLEQQILKACSKLKVKLNKHGLNYCSSGKEVIFFKDGHMVTVGINTNKIKSKELFQKIIGGIK